MMIMVIMIIMLIMMSSTAREKSGHPIRLLRYRISLSDTPAAFPSHYFRTNFRPEHTRGETCALIFRRGGINHDPRGPDGAFFSGFFFGNHLTF